MFDPRQQPDTPCISVIPQFCNAFAKNKPLVIFGDVLIIRNFTYVDNDIQANMLALLNPELEHHQVYNVACGDHMSLNEMVEMLRRISGKEIQPTYAAERPGDVKHSKASIDKIRRELGYRPSVRFEEGLRRTWDWIQCRP